MPMPALVKSWLYSVNNRISYVSVNQVVGGLLYTAFSAGLITAGGFTCVGSSSGVTATGNLSGSNAWTSAAVPVVRGAGTGNLQSWIVIRDGNGWDWLITYQGAADNNIKMSVSPGQLWVLNGTNVAFQPTATDEIIVATNTLDYASATASLDRISHTQWSTDKKIWRSWVCRNSLTVSMLAGELVTSTVNGTFSPPVVGVATTAASQGSSGGVLGAGGVNTGGFTRINSILVTCGGSGESFLGQVSAAAFAVEQPELQATSLVVTVGFASATASARGKVGDRIDAWASYQNTADQTTDVYDSSMYTGFGGMGVFPWNGTAKVVA